MNNLPYLLTYSFLIFTLIACNPAPPRQKPMDKPLKDAHPEWYTKISGNTMGTKYHISYKDKKKRTFQTDVDQLLVEINNEVSTYERNSVISQFNQFDRDTFWFDEAAFSGVSPDFKHFLTNYKLAKKVYNLSNGAMDPTVMPLVNYWGFGYTEKKIVTRVDSANVTRMKKLIGFDKVELIESPRIGLVKSNPKIELDFSAFAKGYGVDALADFFIDQGIDDFFIEIGGEVRVKGVNPQGHAWRIGINTPKESTATDDIFKILPLRDKAIATSGNYRNYYKTKGKKYGHTIDPGTGYPKISKLLSTSVISDECMIADAFATACMVLGVDAALKLAEQIPGIEIYLIYGKNDGTMGTRYSKGLDITED